MARSLRVVSYNVGVTSPAQRISPAKLLTLQRALGNTDALFLQEALPRVGNAFEPCEAMQPFLANAQCAASYAAVARGPVVLEAWAEPTYSELKPEVQHKYGERQTQAVRVRGVDMTVLLYNHHSRCGKQSTAPEYRESAVGELAKRAKRCLEDGTDDAACLLGDFNLEPAAFERVLGAG